MTSRLFNVQIELHKNFKKVILLLSIILLAACGTGGGSQGRIFNKIQANAEGGDPHAQYLMGTYYFNGTKDSFGKQVYPQNKERAKEFFDKAMSSGDKTAQKNVSQFLATAELSTQLNISNSMAQNFVVVYGVTNLKEYESAVSEIKSLGYPVKNITSITPTEVIFYLDFKKNANQKNIALPKAVQDLKKEQDAKIAQQLAKEAETKRQAEQARQKALNAKAEQERTFSAKQSQPPKAGNNATGSITQLNCVLSNNVFGVGGWRVVLNTSNMTASASFIGAPNAWAGLTGILLDNTYQLVADSYSDAGSFYRFGIVEGKNYRLFMINRENLEFKYAASDTGSTKWGRCNRAPVINPL